MMPWPPGKMIPSKLLTSSFDRSCIWVTPCPWLKRAASAIMFLCNSPKRIINTIWVSKDQMHQSSVWKMQRNFANTGSPHWPAASSRGPSPWPAAGSGQTSGSLPRYGSGGTLCWRQRRQLLHALYVMTERWENFHTHYTPSWTSVPSHQPHPENTWATAWFTRHNHIPIVSWVRSFFLSAYHCNVGVPPVAVISVVNKARRLASQKSQRLLGQQSPGGLHDSAETSERREWWNSFLLSAFAWDSDLPGQSVYIHPNVATWRCHVSSIF